jgi:tRNA threonylcarbamoyladenosine biosynthesis protein TsaB
MQPPKLLLLETSGRVGQVGLALGDEVLREASLHQAQRNARDLVPGIDRLMKEEQWKPGELDAVAVSAGPGSYTGLRVGLMMAKTWCYTLKKPLITIPTFEVIAWQTFQLSPSIVALEVIADAQQDRLYQQQFSSRLLASELTLVNLDAWLASLQPEWTITGPGVEKVQSKLPAGINMLSEVDRYPQLFALAALGMARFIAKEWANTMQAEPLYLRASSAEEQWAKLGK